VSYIDEWIGIGRGVERGERVHQWSRIACGQATSTLISAYEGRPTKAWQSATSQWLAESLVDWQHGSYVPLPLVRYCEAWYAPLLLPWPLLYRKLPAGSRWQTKRNRLNPQQKTTRSTYPREVLAPGVLALRESRPWPMGTKHPVLPLHTELPGCLSRAWQSRGLRSSARVQPKARWRDGGGGVG